MMVLGVYVYGALALSLLFVLAMSSGDRPAALLVIGSCGCAYAAQIAGSGEAMKTNALMAIASLAFAASAFLKLWGPF